MESPADNWSVECKPAGRCGYIFYREGMHDLPLFWEYGGKEAVLIAHVEQPHKFNAKYPWAVERVAEILDRVAREIISQQAPSCSAEIDTLGLCIYVREQPLSLQNPVRTNKTFIQLPLEKMEHGLCLEFAVINLPPKRITELFDVTFQTRRDGLDHCLAALLCTAEGQQFALRSYFRGPYAHVTEVIGNEMSPNAVREAESFLNALGVEKKFIIWQMGDPPQI